jgi:kynurenine formamidase
VRPLVVISIAPQVRHDPGYHLQVADALDWERRHGRIPAGAVVFVRSDWSKRWPDPRLSTEKVFPGVKLEALRWLHEQRHILMHGHEPLDTDTTPSLEGESWLMHHGYTQAEGVANLDQVPEAGALVAIGYPKLQGGTGGYARYIAICPPDWPHGLTVDQAPGAPLPRQAKPLHWDRALGMRVR